MKQSQLKQLKKALQKRGFFSYRIGLNYQVFVPVHNAEERNILHLIGTLTSLHTIEGKDLETGKDVIKFFDLL